MSGLAAFASDLMDGTLPDELANLIKRPGFKEWADKVLAARGCAKPVRLSGVASIVDQDGGVLGETCGSVFVPCKNRRETVCASCSAHYAHDTYHLVHAGMAGGKTVPETVTGHPQLLVTLTAPSFGPVHSHSTTKNGKPRRCRCGHVHHEYDRRLGAPIDPDTYDWVGVVLWQAHASELWRRFTIAVARELAKMLGVPRSRLREHLRVSYTKVAEYQRRGLVHFHAVVRIDGPDGPQTRPPTSVDVETLTRAVRYAAATVTVTTPDSPATGARTLGWGEQVDAAPITADEADGAAWQHKRTAGYVAKYATKGTALVEGTDRRLRSVEDIHHLDAPEHAKTLMRTAWRLGGVDELAHLNLRKWAHMLGFRGHFLTKSRRYSTTFTALRQTRADWRLDQHRAALGIDDTTEITVVGDWTMTGIGYRSRAEHVMAGVYAELHLSRSNLDGQGDDPPPTAWAA